jgi:hypothetical protein
MDRAMPDVSGKVAEWTTYLGLLDLKPGACLLDVG